MCGGCQSALACHHCVCTPQSARPTFHCRLLTKPGLTVSVARVAQSWEPPGAACRLSIVQADRACCLQGIRHQRPKARSPEAPRQPKAQRHQGNVLCCSRDGWGRIVGVETHGVLGAACVWYDVFGSVCYSRQPCRGLRRWFCANTYQVGMAGEWHGCDEMAVSVKSLGSNLSGHVIHRVLSRFNGP
jgi:hypothetical protein